jgi:hypothetical protein
MKIIESREQRVLDLTVTTAANDEGIAADQTDRHESHRPRYGWSPYYVWLTRISLFRHRDPRSTGD